MYLFVDFVSALRLFLVRESRGYTPLWCAGFSAVASLVAEHRLKGVQASVVVS